MSKTVKRGGIEQDTAQNRRKNGQKRLNGNERDESPWWMKIPRPKPGAVPDDCEPWMHPKTNRKYRWRPE